MLRDLHMLPGIGQQQRAVDLHPQRLPVIAHDAAQRGQAQVLAYGDRGCRSAGNSKNVAIAADAGVATALKAAEGQRRAAVQIGIGTHNRIHRTLRIHHHGGRALDAQRDNHLAIPDLLGGQHIAVGIQHFHVARRRGQAHGERNIVTDQSVVHISKADGVLLVQPPQVVLCAQRDIATNDHRLSIQRGAVGGFQRIGIEHIAQLILRPLRIIGQAVMQLRLARRCLAAVANIARQVIAESWVEACSEGGLLLPSRPEGICEDHGQARIALGQIGSHASVIQAHPLGRFGGRAIQRDGVAACDELTAGNTAQATQLEVLRVTGVHLALVADDRLISGTLIELEVVAQAGQRFFTQEASCTALRCAEDRT
ncbi:hypothetical protein D3C81_489830 [compost metagenome]